MRPSNLTGSPVSLNCRVSDVVDWLSVFVGRPTADVAYRQFVFWICTSFSAGVESRFSLLRLALAMLHDRH
jgi:ABC-type cobalamin transport system permease subunit